MNDRYKTSMSYIINKDMGRRELVNFNIILTLIRKIVNLFCFKSNFKLNINDYIILTPRYVAKYVQL